MIFNILNERLNDKRPIEMTEKEFWIMFLTIRDMRTNKLSKKEIDIISDYLSGNEPEKLTGNYKTYVKKIKAKNIDLNRKTIPEDIHIHINARISKT